MRIRNPNMPRQPMQPNNPRGPRPSRYDGVGDGPSRPRLPKGPINIVKPRPGMTAPTGTAAMVGKGLSQQAAAQASLDKMKMGARGMKKGGMATMRIPNPNMPRPPTGTGPGRPRPKPTGATTLPVKKGNSNLPQFTPRPKGPMSQYMRDGGMAHGTKAKKGRGMAIMIAIGKPKGRGKS
jgi:hypothetical protein